MWCGAEHSTGPAPGASNLSSFALRPAAFLLQDDEQMWGLAEQYVQVRRDESFVAA
jgi:hypothetical protein